MMGSQELFWLMCPIKDPGVPSKPSGSQDTGFGHILVLNYPPVLTEMRVISWRIDGSLLYIGDKW